MTGGLHPTPQMAQIVNPPLLRPVNARRSTGAGGSRPSLRGETVAVVCPPPAVTVIVSCMLAGCAEPTPSQTSATVTVTDSGEVQLVEVAGRFLDSLPVWSLSAEPLVTIGERVAEDPYMFGGVEDALRLHTGEIVIVEEFDFEFRVFGSDGGFRRAFGGMGRGSRRVQGRVPAKASTWGIRRGGQRVGESDPL